MTPLETLVREAQEEFDEKWPPFDFLDEMTRENALLCKQHNNKLEIIKSFLASFAAKVFAAGEASGREKISNYILAHVGELGDVDYYDVKKWIPLLKEIRSSNDEGV